MQTKAPFVPSNQTTKKRKKYTHEKSQKHSLNERQKAKCKREGKREGMKKHMPYTRLQSQLTLPVMIMSSGWHLHRWFRFSKRRQTSNRLTSFLTVCLTVWHKIGVVDTQRCDSRMRHLKIQGCHTNDILVWWEKSVMKHILTQTLQL